MDWLHTIPLRRRDLQDDHGSPRVTEAGEIKGLVKYSLTHRGLGRHQRERLDRCPCYCQSADQKYMLLAGQSIQKSLMMPCRAIKRVLVGGYRTS